MSRESWDMNSVYYGSQSCGLSSLSLPVEEERKLLGRRERDFQHHSLAELKSV